MPNTRIRNPHFQISQASSRREFLTGSTVAGLALGLSPTLAAKMTSTRKMTNIGLLADLHQDIMHDGQQRVEAFAEHMKTAQPDAVLQLGDFAVPHRKNEAVVNTFNQCCDTALHTIGNHDTDGGHTKQQCLDAWGMPHRYYTQRVGGVDLIVLDGNDTGSPTHRGGYPSFIGPEQFDWLTQQLKALSGPILIVSHQPLAGYAAIDNSDQVRSLLTRFADKILMAINGHSHIDQVIRDDGVNYLHVNSASYQWVGSKFKHRSYRNSIHQDHPSIASTCPYRDPLFATITIDPTTMLVTIKGRQSEWVGPSPAKLGNPISDQLIPGEHVAPRIRDRRIARVKVPR